ncbi:glycosyltransferase family 39 protein [Actinoplanes utahensis]|uniref:Glycosyl transferase n=1 Tax=Actinoplanes utahensis TaxID=1869 RepID=A0A0A6UFK7_ACTUT|nr:glycosyltransferase family 39 protein [Actinoplanes utahensis]KHD73853.1 glycosyl transferase [Actinoplanes utahensis]GIF27756.1 glycosyl transferase [Actinoplanes utahensis]
MTSLSPVAMDVPADAPPPSEPSRDRSGWAKVLFGRSDAAWIRPSLYALLLLTAVLYLWGLGASGWANAFYSAAVQAGSESWKAFFFGSSDAANSITVDKTPAALWIMALSVRVFGLSSWSILAPQALLGVATTGLLYATVRRGFGPAAGLIAGLVSALTPVAVLMFRFNNPDALLVLSMVAGAYTTVRAVETGATKWIVLTGVLVGFAFLAKQLQALLVVPAFGLAYLVAGPPRIGKRIVQLLLALAAMIASAGWYIAIVDLVPASARPYIGGSQNNSLLELTLGYNGLGRLNGEETGSVGNAASRWGAIGWTRMFDSEQGGQVSWLLPAALILLVAGLVVTARRARTDARRAALIIWGGWLLTTGLIFSFMQGIFHAYYTVALAPAIGAVVGMGAGLLWKRRDNLVAALTLAVAAAVTAWWSYTLLGRSADFLPWLRLPVLIVGLAAAVALALSVRLPARPALVAGIVAVVAGLAGPAAYAVQTASEPHTGSIPSAGPAVAGGRGAMPGGGRGGPNGGGFPGGGARPQDGVPPAGGPRDGGQRFGQGGQDGRGARGGGMGGLLDAARVSEEVKALLERDADRYTWAAAAIGSQSASGYQLATEQPVMAVGGFNGTDPSPTLARFQQYVADGEIHYFIGGGGFARGGGNGGSDESAWISEWVTANFTPQTVGGTTLYDLTAPKS